MIRSTAGIPPTRGLVTEGVTAAELVEEKLSGEGAAV
jgi:hypothetical protein